MKSQLESVRQRKYVGVAELTEQAASILSERGPVQDRGTVSEVPDERTIRYYLTEGLLSAAEEKQGTASVFGYIHLLQLLVVKKLQADHLPIRKIRELVQGRSEHELERLLGFDGKAAATKASKNEALSYLETLLTKRHASSSSPPNPLSSPSPSSRAHAGVAPSGSLHSSATTTGGAWERVEIEPGLELHIHDQYQTPSEPTALRRLTQSIARTLELFGRKRPGKRGR
ncbi:MAG TPA: MerR family transcriptional regulator [Pyrinomonadaceae bacterium]